ncbi:MAG: zinc ribbon domain-containing protein, partial [Spirochaetaceae bacterium]|nr:zinc ribbon domain-containing protein [Spirochaetaceae bacterium]
MYCANCGTKLDDNLKFCTNCGAAVQGGIVPRTETPPPAGAFGGITPDQMRANTMEGLTDSALREIHEGYKGNPIPPVPAAKKP